MQSSFIYSALVPGHINIDVTEFDLKDGSCGCKLDNVRKKEFPMNFTLDHFYNETEKAKFLTRRKNDLNQFYQRNYFDQLGENGQIVTKPTKNIQFVSSGLIMAPDQLINLGLKIIDVNENELGEFEDFFPTRTRIEISYFSINQSKISIWDICRMGKYFPLRK